MTDPKDTPTTADGNEREPSEPTSSGWFDSVFRAIPPKTGQDEDQRGTGQDQDRRARVGDRPPKMLARITRAQKLIAAISALGVAAAMLASTSPMPWPVSELQQVFRSALGADSGFAYMTSTALLAIVIMVGVLLQWFAISWRLARFPVGALFAFAGGGVVVIYYLGRTPTRTLFGWLVIATLSIMYVHYYRKGRFGYTRGASAAVFAQLTLLICFIAIPLTLFELVGGGQARQVAEAERSQRCVEWLNETLLDRPVNRPLRDDEKPEECRDETDEDGLNDPASARTGGPVEGAPPSDLPPHAVHVSDAGNRIEIATNATSSDELRALFDAVQAEYPTLTRRMDQLDRQPGYEVLIRCAAVPDLPGVDPVLATGAFALSEQAADQMGLASVRDAAFETRDRRDCAPPPLPWDAVTGEEVVAATRHAGLVVGNARGQGISTCYALGCLQQTATDQFMITVWPTADVAETWANRKDAQAKAFALSAMLGAVMAGPSGIQFMGRFRPPAVGPGLGLGEGAALAGIPGMLDAVSNPPDFATVMFGPVTTVDIPYEPLEQMEQVRCRDRSVEHCVDAYVNRLESAAASLERSRNAPSDPGG